MTSFALFAPVQPNFVSSSAAGGLQHLGQRRAAAGSAESRARSCAPGYGGALFPALTEAPQWALACPLHNNRKECP